MDDDAFQVQPLDALLAGYAAGSLSAPLAALVEAHLELKPESRRFVAALAALGGVLLDGIAPIPLENRGRVLAGALANAPDPAATAPSRAEQDALLPPSLLRLIGRDPKALAWRWVIPGLRECPILVGPGVQVSLVRITAGARMPAHTHTGDEVVLVLDGGFSDANGDYRRGDVEIADETFSHRPIAHRDRDCLFFVVRDGPVKLTGPIGRIIQLFRRDEP
jgi:putative transcriptional regulator